MFHLLSSKSSTLIPKPNLLPFEKIGFAIALLGLISFSTFNTVFTEETILIKGTPIPQAQEPITAKVYVGFDPELPMRREQTWVPITVELLNNQKELAGELSIRVKDGRETYRIPVNLPTKTKKSYSLFVHVPEQLDELEFSVQSGRKQFPLQSVTVVSGYADNNRFIAVLSPERGTHEHFVNQPEEDIESYRRVLYTNPSLLPRYWVGYQNIDVLIWDGAAPVNLSTEQIHALETWIQYGGTLVLASGERWQELNASSFRLYAPMMLNGSRALAAGARVNQASETVPAILKSGLVIATGELISDSQIKVWLKADTDPFLVERRWGAGRIVWIASTLNIPLFENPAQQRNLEEFLTAAKTPITDKYLSLLDPTFAASLRSLVQADLPSVWFIAGYLGCYILLIVPVNYWVFRRLRRLEWAWFTMPVWAVLFAFGAYYLGALRQQGKVSVSEISVMESHPESPVASTMSYCSIYSPIRQWYSLDYDQPPAFPQLPILPDFSGGSRGTLDESLTVDFMENSLAVKDYLIYHWSQRLLKMLHITPIGKGMEINLKYHGDQVEGTLANHTGLHLKEPMVFYRDHYFSLADLADGQELRILPSQVNASTFSVQEIVDEMQRYPFAPRTNPRDLSTAIRDAKRYYAAQMYDFLIPQGLAVFTAHLDQPQLNFKLNRQSAAPQGKTLFNVIFPLQQELHGRVRIPNTSWIVSENNTRTPFARGMGMYGAPPPGAFPGSPDGGRIVFLSPGTDYNWSMATEAPLKGGRIEELLISVNYQRLYYPSRSPWGRRFSSPQRRNSEGTGRPRNFIGPTGQTNPMTPRGNMAFPPGGLPVIPMNNAVPLDARYWIQIKNIAKQVYEPLPPLLSPQGQLLHPERYVDKVYGTISLRIRGVEPRMIEINSENIAVNALVNYGDDNQSVFLGMLLPEIAEADKEGVANDSH